MTDPAFQRLEEQIKEWQRYSTFEGMVEDLEPICLRYAPETTTTMLGEPQSDAWYASQILIAIRAVRHHLERGEPSHAAAEAVRIGGFAGSWPQAKEWRKKLEHLQRIGARGGRATSEKAQILELDVEEEEEEEERKIRRETPYERRYSTIWLAETIGRRLDQKKDTVRGHLRRLHIK